MDVQVRTDAAQRKDKVRAFDEAFDALADENSMTRAQHILDRSDITGEARHDALRAIIRCVYKGDNNKEARA